MSGYRRPPLSRFHLVRLQLPSDPPDPDQPALLQPEPPDHPYQHANLLTDRGPDGRRHSPSPDLRSRHHGFLHSLLLAEPARRHRCSIEVRKITSFGSWPILNPHFQRYLHIFRWHNVGLVDDDILHVFFSILYSFLPGYFSLLLWWSDLHKIPAWHKCAKGTMIWLEGDFSSSVANLLPIIITLGLTQTLHVGIYFAIYRHESAANSEPTSTYLQEKVRVKRDLSI